MMDGLRVMAYCTIKGVKLSWGGEGGEGMHSYTDRRGQKAVKDA